MLLKTLNVCVLFFMLVSFVQAQNLCPHFLIEKSLVINIEGRFINEKNSRTSVDIQWRHHPEALDTFFVYFPNQKHYRFITAGEYRFLEFDSPKIKRQLGQHHLREHIGDTPLKLDDFELLANGAFLCKDSIEQTKNYFATAFSNTWWSISFNHALQPDSVAMRGARKEVREFYIRQWKRFSGEILPTLIKISGPNYSGDLWIRSVYPIQALSMDPILKGVKRRSDLIPKLFRKVTVEGERKIPLILKLNQEFLGY